LSILFVVSLFFFFASSLSFGLTYGSGEGTQFLPLWYFLIGISTVIVGTAFYILLFSPERVKGFQAEYEISPDLTKFEVVKSFSPNKTQDPVPEMAFCSVCGKEIYKPYKCARCGMILCGSHYLQGSHSCSEGV
jgi:hypothetical protein